MGASSSNDLRAAPHLQPLEEYILRQNEAVVIDARLRMPWPSTMHNIHPWDVEVGDGFCWSRDTMQQDGMCGDALAPSSSRGRVLPFGLLPDGADGRVSDKLRIIPPPLHWTASFPVPLPWPTANWGIEIRSTAALQLWRENLLSVVLGPCQEPLMITDGDSSMDRDSSSDDHQPSTPVSHPRVLGPTCPSCGVPVASAHRARVPHKILPIVCVAECIAGTGLPLCSLHRDPFCVAEV